MKFYYLGTLFFVFCIPTIIAGYFLSKNISLLPLVPFVVCVTLIGSIWDIWATKHGKVDRVWLWQFNRQQTLGITFLGLPAEEFLFYTVSSVYVIFMWEGIKLIMSKSTLDTYLIVIILSGWTLISIAVPYVISPQGDKLIN